MASQDLLAEENIARFAVNATQISQPIDPSLFMLREIDKGKLSGWLSDGATLDQRWKAGDKLLRRKVCGSADIKAKNIYLTQVFRLSAKLTRVGERHVDILGLPLPDSQDKSLALNAAQELVKIATPVSR